MLEVPPTNAAEGAHHVLPTAYCKRTFFIEILLLMGLSFLAIGRELGRGHTTISHEIGRKPVLRLDRGQEGDHQALYPSASSSPDTSTPGYVCRRETDMGLVTETDYSSVTNRLASG